MTQKNNILKSEYPPFIERRKVADYIKTMVYDLYASSFNIEGLNYQENEYFKKAFYFRGNLACFSEKYLKELVFCPFAPQMYNLYYFPTLVTLINERGVSFIPATPQKVDEDVVIAFANASRVPIRRKFSYVVNKLINVEMVIQIALLTHKMPYVFKGSPQAQKVLSALWGAIYDDQPKVFVEELDVGDIEIMNTSNPYILDKLEAYKDKLFNDILTLIGINNLGINEKKEHLITSEVDSNNEYVCFSEDSFFSYIEDFIKRINEKYGTKLKLVKTIDKLNEVRKKANDDRLL